MTMNQTEDDEENMSWGSINAQVKKRFEELEEERFRISPQRTLQSLIPEKSKLKPTKIGTFDHISKCVLIISFYLS